MISPFLASDWPAICRVYDLSKPIELATAGVADTFLELEHDIDRKRDFAESTVLVAEDDGDVRGFVGFRGAFIGWLFVTPDASRMGYGGALLLRAIESIEGEATLWTMEANEAAISLYRKFGFEVVERRDTHNRGLPCRAVKMRRKAAQPGATDNPDDAQR